MKENKLLEKTESEIIKNILSNLDECITVQRAEENYKENGIATIINDGHITQIIREVI